MVKQNVLKEDKTNFVVVNKTLYLKIPASMQNDSAFPFDREAHVKIKMFKDFILIAK